MQIYVSRQTITISNALKCYNNDILLLWLFHDAPLNPFLCLGALCIIISHEGIVMKIKYACESLFRVEKNLLPEKLCLQRSLFCDFPQQNLLMTIITFSCYQSEKIGFELTGEKRRWPHGCHNCNQWVAKMDCYLDPGQMNIWCESTEIS